MVSFEVLYQYVSVLGIIWHTYAPVWVKDSLYGREVLYSVHLIEFCCFTVITNIIMKQEHVDLVLLRVSASLIVTIILHY